MTWQWSSFESVYEVDPGNNATATGLKSGDPTVGGSFSVQLLAEGTFRFRSANKGHVMTVVVRGMGIDQGNAVETTNVLKSGVGKIFASSLHFPADSGQINPPVAFWDHLKPTLKLVEAIFGFIWVGRDIFHQKYAYGAAFSGILQNLVFIRGEIDITANCLSPGSGTYTLPAMFGKLRYIMGRTSSGLKIQNNRCTSGGQQSLVNWHDFDSVEYIFGSLSVMADSTSSGRDEFIEAPADFLPNLKCVDELSGIFDTATYKHPPALVNRLRSLPKCTS